MTGSREIESNEVEKNNPSWDTKKKIHPSRYKRHGIYINVVTDHIAKAPKTEDLSLLKSMIEAEMIRPVIDKTYSLEEIVDAHRYVEKGHKKGNVVIQIGR